MIVKDAIRNFYFHQTGNGIAPTTARAYRSILESFPGQEKELQEITPAHLQDFLAGFSNLSPGSRNSKKAAVKSFFKWALEMDYLSKDPARLIEFEKVPQKEAAFMSLSEIQKFRCAIKDNERDRLLFEIFLNTGMRLSEVVSLNCGIKGKSSFSIIGKGGKARQIFFPKYLTDLVGNSVNGNPPDSPLFISASG